MTTLVDIFDYAAQRGSSPPTVRTVVLGVPGAKGADGGGGSGSLTVEGPSGNPSVANVSKIRLADGVVTDETGGYVILSGLKGDPGDPGKDGSPGADGDDGAPGADGWSPLFAIVADNDRRVLQVADWVGGDGDKPTTGFYLGSTGLVVNIAEAVDIRGPSGPNTISGDTTTAFNGVLVGDGSKVGVSTQVAFKDQENTFTKAQTFKGNVTLQGSVLNVSTIVGPDGVESGVITISENLIEIGNAALVGAGAIFLTVSGDGSGLWDLNANSLSLGTVPSARLPANVKALADMTGEADRGVYFTGAGSMALFTLTSFARQLADDADAATARGTLGATTIGGNTFTQTNPSALGYNRVNADNTITHRTPPQVVADINVVVTESGGTGTISDSTHRGRTVLFTDDTPEWEAPTGLTEGFICSLFPPIGKTLELTAGAGATVQAAGTTVGQNGAVLFWVSANTYRLSGDVS